jgi:molybdopterin-guanine dinucleotide biosynthesis protein A
MTTQVGSVLTSAAILAGGQARRLGGRDKSRLVVEGHPIIVRQLGVLQPIADEIFIVASNGSRFADLGVEVVPDRAGGLGAIGGIDTALSHARGDRVVVVACDLPFLTSSLLALLVERASDADGAWVHASRGVEPLVACYTKAALPRIREAIARGQLRARELAGVLHMREIGSDELQRFGDETRLLANVNTADDYARVQYRRQ